ncbi:uncharacterized protein LOC103950294 [Pyrus x bretschneideri]|uniref:uncharacterized protein LOC103950294 n=1 Tax=Pyrus x bretschneideri TaxID=225117 RepID=UPI00202F2841|nr:uncharacterized protein LOC103950294 [Pyrus x bretschneideri]
MSISYERFGMERHYPDKCSFVSHKKYEVTQHCECSHIYHRYGSQYSGTLLAWLLAFSLQIYFFSPISPDSLHLPPPSLLPRNNILKKVITATRDGWIKRVHTKGSWENRRKVNSDTVFGITFTKDGDLVTCDTDQEGLLKVIENGVTGFTSHVNGSKIRLDCFPLHNLLHVLLCECLETTYFNVSL